MHQVDPNLRCYREIWHLSQFCAVLVHNCSIVHFVVGIIYERQRSVDQRGSLNPSLTVRPLCH